MCDMNVRRRFAPSTSSWSVKVKNIWAPIGRRQQTNLNGTERTCWVEQNDVWIQTQQTCRELPVQSRWFETLFTFGLKNAVFFLSCSAFCHFLTDLYFFAKIDLGIQSHKKKNNNVGGMKQKKKQSIKEKMTKGHFVTWQQLFISQLYFFYWRMFCCFLFINSESKVSLSTNLKIAKLRVTPKNTNIHFCWMSFGHSKEMCT